MVRLAMLTTMPGATLKTRLALLPLIVRALWPGPLMMRLSVMSNSPPVRVMVGVELVEDDFLPPLPVAVCGREKSISAAAPPAFKELSWLLAWAMAQRSEPALP